MTTRRERFRARREAIAALQLWWLDRMLASPSPLQEKMTLYFHGHFTSRATPMFPSITYEQNALFRRNALGNLQGADPRRLQGRRDAALSRTARRTSRRTRTKTTRAS